MLSVTITMRSHRVARLLTALVPAALLPVASLVAACHRAAPVVTTDPPAPPAPTPSTTTATPSTTTATPSTPATTAVDPGATIAAPVTTTTASTTARTGPLVLGTGPVIVRGTLTRELSTYADNRPWVLADGNHLDVLLLAYRGEDAPAPEALRAQLTLPPGPFTLPREYELRGTLPAGDLTYLLSVEVHSGGTARPLQLGSEYQNRLRPGTARLDIKLTGLEPCDAPNAGGYCG